MSYELYEVKYGLKDDLYIIAILSYKLWHIIITKNSVCTKKWNKQILGQ